MKKIQALFKNKSKMFLVLMLVVVTPFFSGCGSVTPSGYKVNLEIWGTFDNALAYLPIIDQYKKVNPYIGDIKYRKFAEGSYRQELIDAMAAGQGPDIFLIGNAWLPSFENKLEPALAPLMSEQDVKNNFPDVVAADFIDAGKVYAAPLSVDSMVLYYNRDMFNAVGITSPPKTWMEFQNDVQMLTKQNATGGFSQMGAAIGSGTNINRATDLLSLIMLQNGAQFPIQKGMSAKLDQGIIGGDGKVFQTGEQSLNFYTQFARISTSSNAINQVYTWNNKQHDSVDAFAEGSVAMMFNYSWQMAEIKNKNPKLNFSVVEVPQTNSDKPLTYANYWGYAVSRNKNSSSIGANGKSTSVPISNAVRTHEAWQFIRFLTLKNSGTIKLYNAITKNSKDFAVGLDPAKEYLKKTKMPAARRDLIEIQKSDPVLGVFATSNLIAKSWYQKDADAADKILINMIESVNRGDANLRGALQLANNQINSLSR